MNEERKHFPVLRSEPVDNSGNRGQEDCHQQAGLVGTRADMVWYPSTILRAILKGPVPSQVWTYRYSNGAQISMVDLRSYKIMEIFKRSQKVSFKSAIVQRRPQIGSASTREPEATWVEENALCLQVAHLIYPAKGGTVIHLSIYFLMNTYATSGIREDNSEI
ncbi:hypothetical protein CABS01_11756 [Colletotrichum abscissum]|uniref:uncharacterized protein n=1 Tax=Colletotrichum abscissum TaxID=1671311 RepID=UPI0027D5C810|nr:uncharacterized protein CABS01_11756 [Colletotrichum abscissum]KAK1492859.1 hypothetical protein CABS01_11756 [Colletotrichum abscissum]